MEVTVKSEVRQDFKSSCECLKTNLARVRLKAMDKLQVHRDTYMCMYYMYVYIINYVLRLLTFHLLQLVTYCDL